MEVREVELDYNPEDSSSGSPAGATMQCSKPIWLTQYEMFVPCGKCRACRIARSSEWAHRIMHDLDRDWETVCRDVLSPFWTLIH